MVIGLVCCRCTQKIHIDLHVLCPLNQNWNGLTLSNKFLCYQIWLPSPPTIVNHDDVKEIEGKNKDAEMEWSPYCCGFQQQWRTPQLSKKSGSLLFDYYRQLAAFESLQESNGTVELFRGIRENSATVDVKMNNIADYVFSHSITEDGV